MFVVWGLLCSAQVSDRAEDLGFKIWGLLFGMFDVCCLGFVVFGAGLRPCRGFVILLWIFRRGQRTSPTDKEMKKKDISFKYQKFTSGLRSKGQTMATTNFIYVLKNTNQ